MIDIHAEVKIPVALNLRPVVDKTLVASNLESIKVTSDVDVFYFRLAPKMRSFDDVLLFSNKAKDVDNNKTSIKRE